MFCRVGHLTLPSGSGHWVLLHSYLDNGSDVACAARRRRAMKTCSSPGCCLVVGSTAARVRKSETPCVFYDANDALLQASTRRGVLRRYRNVSDQGREYALATMSTECRAFFTGFGKQCCHVFCHFGVRGQRFRLETWCKVRVLRQLQVEDIVCASPSGLRRVSVLLQPMEPESQGISMQKLRRRHRAEITTALQCEHNTIRRTKTKTLQDLKDRCQQDSKKWVDLLACRQMRPCSRAEDGLRQFRNRILEEKGIVRRNMGIQAARPPRGAPVSMETCLPFPSESFRSAERHNLCTHRAWAMCQHCHCLMLQDLIETTLSGPNATFQSGSGCPQCARVRRTVGDIPDDVPLDVPRFHMTC